MRCIRCGTVNALALPSCSTCKLPADAPPDFTQPEHDAPGFVPWSSVIVRAADIFEDIGPSGIRWTSGA